MNGGSQPTPDLPSRATRPVGGTSDQDGVLNKHAGRSGQGQTP
jgi:hypothetical protein